MDEEWERRVFSVSLVGNRIIINDPSSRSRCYLTYRSFSYHASFAQVIQLNVVEARRRK
jgi:hypothetical protein